MGSENVEIVERIYESFRMRDVETIFECLDRDVVWVSEEAGIPDMDRVYHGHEGVRSFWRQWLAAWEEIDFEIVELEEIAGGRVRARIRQRNKGRGTGIWVDQRPYDQIWTRADGRVIRVDLRWVE